MKSDPDEKGELPTDVILQDRWKTSYQIGIGSFGKVFRATDLQNDQLVAIKRQVVKEDADSSAIQREVHLLNDIGAAKKKVPECIARILHDQVLREGRYHAMVMPQYGPDFKNLKQTLFRVRTERAELYYDDLERGPMKPMGFHSAVVLHIAVQMADALAFLHAQGYIYHDMKPANILLAKPNPEVTKIQSTRVVLVDFGLAARWRDPETMQPIRTTRDTRRAKSGTPKYAATSIHAGHSPSRVADLESLIFTLVDLRMSHLPWSHIERAPLGKIWRLIGHSKEEIFLSEWRDAGVPDVFLQLLEMCNQLKIKQAVPWSQIQSILSDARAQHPSHQLWMGVDYRDLQSIASVLSQPDTNIRWRSEELEATKPEWTLPNVNDWALSGGAVGSSELWSTAETDADPWICD